MTWILGQREKIFGGVVQLRELQQGREIIFSNRGKKIKAMYDGIVEEEGLQMVTMISRFGGVIKVTPFLITNSRPRTINFESNPVSRLYTPSDVEYELLDERLRRVRI